MEEAKLKRSNKRFMNQELQKLFPEYTIESIKGVKNKKGQYAKLLAEEVWKLERETQLPGETESEDSEKVEKALENIRVRIDLEHVLGRWPRDEVLSRDQEIIDCLLESVFPVVAIVKRGARARAEENTEELPNKTKRKILYRKAQQMFEKDPSKLFDHTVNDSLGAQQWMPEDAEPYWKELLCIESPKKVLEVKEKQEKPVCATGDNI